MIIEKQTVLPCHGGRTGLSKAYVYGGKVGHGVIPAGDDAALSKKPWGSEGEGWLWEEEAASAGGGGAAPALAPSAALGARGLLPWAAAAPPTPDVDAFAALSALI